MLGARAAGLILGTLLAGLLVLPGASGAQGAGPAPPVRALLIGVQDYPGLPQALRLQAPAGDAERLAAVLEGAGLPAGAIELMTERAGVRPTRAAILKSLARLAAEARPGERVLIYFSGHGAQAPARHPAREPDGLEELFLAADAARWDGRAKAVPGAVADFELEAAIAAIRAKGADVWFVADACHAAGLTRSGLPPGARAKSVSAAALGVPGAGRALRGARGRESSPLAAETAPGRYTGFYAAAPGQLALERPAADGRPVSVFSWGLGRAISQGRFRSFRDLALALSATPEVGLNAPAPVFEGALDGSMLGLEPHARLVPVGRRGGAPFVTAGSADGYELGAAVEIVDADGRVVAGARVARADLAGAVLAPDRVLPDDRLFARVVRPGDARSDAPRGVRLLTALEPLAGAGAARELRVEARLWRNGCGPNPPARLGLPEGPPIDLLQGPRLRHCDVVYLALTNTGERALDVSPLYVDAEGSIVALALAPDDEVRLEPGRTRFIAARLLTRTPDGRPLPRGAERLVLIVVPARPGPPADLRGLAGPAPERGGAPPPGEDLGALVFAWRVDD